MKISLYRGGRARGTWLDVKHMLIDLQHSRVMLEPGDQLTVVDEEKQKTFSKRLRSHLHLVSRKEPLND